MNDQQLHDVLERVSHSAPQVDASGMARTATALAGRSRRRTYALAVPAAAAAAAVVVVATGAALDSQGSRVGSVTPLADPAASKAAAVVPSAAAPSAAGPSAAGPSAAGHGSVAAPQAMAYGAIGAWTCCDDADRAELVKPGGSFVAHFRSSGAGVTGHPITIRVALTGPFAGVKAMVTDPPVPGGSRYTSVPLTLPGRADGVQVATVSIPDTAEPGLYLVSLVHGSTGSSAGSIQITR
jgi:hypothetical protein